MSVVASIEDVGPWRKRLTVEVPAPAVDAETQRVVREYGQKVRIPGFRRGKVPAELVRRRFAKDIDQEVIDRLLPRYWRQAQAESEIEPLLPPEVEEVRVREAGGSLTFIATVETRPHIELRNLRDFELPDPATEPGELDVDKALDDLRIRFGEWVPVTRAAARGDLVTAEIIDLTDSSEAAATPPHGADGSHGSAATEEPASAPADAEGSQVDEGVRAALAAHAANIANIANTASTAAPEPVEFEVGDQRVWEELSLAVSGLTEGQEMAFTREAPEPDGAPPPPPDAVATQARPRRFKVKVTAVKERELPALDDELAARVNPDLGGLKALREMAAAHLREARVEERHEARRRALLDQLRERHPLELPQGVVQREIERIAEDYGENLSRRGVRPEQAEIDWQRLREEARPHAERMVYDRLLLDAIAAAEAVTVTDEEFERTLAALARAQRTTTPVLRKALDENGRLASLREHMRRDKTVRHLLGEADPAPPHEALEAPAAAEPPALPGGGDPAAAVAE
jgi:trigger factor